MTSHRDPHFSIFVEHTVMFRCWYIFLLLGDVNFDCIILNNFDTRGEKCFLTKKKFWKINSLAEINVSRMKRKRDDTLLSQKRMEY